MLILQPNEVCKYSNKCRYNKNNTCMGSNPVRQNVFTCEYVNQGNITEEGQMRHSLDTTGKMKVIME